MNPKIKKLIAREGLVILGVIALGFIWKVIPYEKPSYLYYCSFDGSPNWKVYKIETNHYYSTWDNNDKLVLLKEISKKYPKDIEQEGDWITIPENIKVERSEAKYTLKGRIKNGLSTFALFVFILSYPAYLVIRFIIWAVRAIKEE